MPLTRLRFSVNGDVQLSRAFEASEREMRDLSEPFADMGDVIIASVGQQFRTEGAYGLGTKWKQLNREYAAWKESVVGPNPILVFTGGMRAAMLSRRSLTITPRQLVYEPDIPPTDDDTAGERGVWHQEGEGHNPQRKMVALTMVDRRNIERAFHSWLRTSVPIWRAAQSG